MNKRNVYLAQVNHAYGKNVFLPYSVGLLQAYALSIPEIRDAFAFKELFFLREDIDTVLTRADKPDAFGISCYLWNWRYSMALACAVRSAYPDCLIVLGGPNVPLDSRGFFQAHPYADVLVHYEGELAFADVLRERLAPRPEYAKIAGLTIKMADGSALKTPPRPRIDDLSVIPSPYLDGIFDRLTELPYDFHASQETHRGCPYSCAFCDWGAATMSKVRAFSDERLIAEFEWCGRNKVEMLYNCDANYGLLPRDLGLTVAMAETNRRYGFPRKFRAAYAKNSNDAVFRIAQVLNQAGMNKGITLSFQSMDQTALDNVRRKNIQVTDFEGLVRRYRQNEVATYSEIIIGLPGETYGSFAAGIDTLVHAGQHDSLQIYTCEVLSNAEMNDPAYREKHGIRTIMSPMPFFHSSAGDSGDRHPEYHEIVIETATMPLEDWKQMQMFAWAVQCFHCLSLTQYLAVFLHARHGMSYKAFYEGLLKFARANPDMRVGRAFLKSQALFEEILKGGELYTFDKRFGNVNWPLEEGTFLDLVVDKRGFYREMEQFLSVLVTEAGYGIDPALIEDLLAYQEKMLIDPFADREFSFPLRHNLHEFFCGAYVGKQVALRPEPCTVKVAAADSFGGDLVRYAKDIIWYGRKGGKFRHSKVSVLPGTPNLEMSVD